MKKIEQLMSNSHAKFHWKHVVFMRVMSLWNLLKICKNTLYDVICVQPGSIKYFYLIDWTKKQGDITS